MKSCSPPAQGGHRVQLPPLCPGTVLWNPENVCEPRMILDSWTKFSHGRGLESASRRLLVPEQGRVLSFGIDFFPASSSSLSSLSSSLLRRQRTGEFHWSVAPFNLLLHDFNYDIVTNVYFNVSLFRVTEFQFPTLEYILSNLRNVAACFLPTLRSFLKVSRFPNISAYF